MNEDKRLPISVPSGALTTLASSSLLDRGLAGLRRSAEEDEAEKLYQQATALCTDVDFITISDINTPLLNTTDWKWHPAISLFTKAAGLDHRDSKFCLGAIHAHSNPLTAVNWYRKAADQSHPEAAFQFVKYLYLDPPEQRSSFAAPISLEKVCELLEVAAREKHVRAASELGFILLNQAEDAETQDRESLLVRASIWFRQAAEAGEADAAFQYAELLSLDDGVLVDFSEAARWYAIAVEQGHRKAMVELAYLYERGQGVSSDQTAAAELYKRAGKLAREEADLADAIICFKLAAALDDAESSYLLSGVIFQGIPDRGGNIHVKKKAEALHYLEISANKGYLPAAYELGLRYQVTGDYKTANKWYLKAALAGHVDAQSYQGYISFEDGNYNEAIHWYRKAAEQGDVEAAFLLAELLRQQVVSGKDFNPQEAAKWMIFAADHDHAEALFYAGWMLHEGFGIERDDVKSVNYYRVAAKNNNPSAITSLGYMYANGFGVKKDDVFAFRYFKLGAKLGNAIAKNNLANSYKNGKGTAHDPDEAIYWMTEAADEDEEATAQYNLGLWYRQGELVEQDDETALLWIEKAAKQGHEGANTYAGWMHQNGKGCEIDPAKACEYYRFAADQGLALAQSNLAIMYESGLGVEHDTEEAIRWYRLAARQMQQQAIDALKRLGVDIHGPVVKPVAPKVSAAVEDRVRKALENVLSKDSAKLTQNK